MNGANEGHADFGIVYRRDEMTPFMDINGPIETVGGFGFDRQESGFAATPSRSHLRRLHRSRRRWAASGYRS
ncbi:MAG: hypothetical protein ACE5EM_12285 [Sphingomonadales bacterium]